MKQRKINPRRVVIIAVICMLAAALLLDPNLNSIMEEKFCTILAHCPQSVKLNVPLDVLTEEAFTNAGQEFEKEEVVVYRTETSTIWLSSVMPANEGGEQMYFSFNISHKLSKAGTILVIDSYFKLNKTEDVSLRGVDPGQSFVCCVDTETARNNEESLEISLTMDQITYAKACWEPKIFPGYEEHWDSDTWAFQSKGALEVMINDLDMDVFADPYKAFETLMVEYADTIDWLQQTYDLEPLDPFNYEDYDTYGFWGCPDDPELDKQCKAVSEILGVYYGCFISGKDIEAVLALPDYISDGTYRSGKVKFWNPLNSNNKKEFTTTVVVRGGRFRVGEEETVKSERAWRALPAVDAEILQNVEEFHGRSLHFSFDEKCLYQPINDDYFLVYRKDHTYLVRCGDLSDPGAAILYIVEIERA